MILVVNLCSEKLHYLEFVKPIENSLKSDFFTKNYLDINEEDLGKSSGVIVCGTSLLDNEFLNNMERFSWIKNYNKPILGICAGFQVIGKVYGGKLGENLEIGYFYENFKKDFFGLSGEAEVYHLHNNSISFGDEFEILCDNGFPQAVRHKERNLFGCLFHPEVRNKEIILNFRDFCRK